MSTPRTDKKAASQIGFHSCATVPASFARELEIETQQLQAERDKYALIAEREIKLRAELATELDALREALSGLLEVTACRLLSFCGGRGAVKARRIPAKALALSQPKP